MSTDGSIRNRRALAVGALLMVLDWLNFTVVPIWGLAQSFARPGPAFREPPEGATPPAD